MLEIVNIFHFKKYLDIAKFILIEISVGFSYQSLVELYKDKKSQSFFFNEFYWSH